ncbi:phage tail protein [Arcobacter arenosus]|uniref:Tail fiber protein n=1 Tax=Arcobacter arenosus TaxID=2576037 RepID=A0A5R8Y5G5_9BACT|nr:phage tail protein [Arcobacter arenosus]TLP41030.1 tail fiber protein [Arcobacter arenosus]
MANLPDFSDSNLTKGGFYTLINTLRDFLSGSIGTTGTPEGVKMALGLDSVENTSDLGKPISTLTQEALDLKSNSDHTHSLKTINEQSIWGSGDLTIEGVPSGCILMWSGAITSIPSGWYLCDGTNGTPDLSDTFIMGTTTEADIGTTGGSADAVVVKHSHTGSTNTAGNHTHTAFVGGNTYDSNGYGNSYSLSNTNSAGDHSHTVTIDNAGVDGANKNLPPYMKLAYIMKG